MIKNSSPFCATDKFAEVSFKETEYVHYMEKESIEEGFDPNKPSEFLIRKDSVEYERIPIDEFINSFASKVGLKNELKGIVSKSQMDDFIMTHKASPGFVDLTQLPDTPLEMASYAARLDEIWSEIPDDLKGSTTKEEFIKSMTADKLKAYVISKLPKKSDEKKEGE